MSAPEAPFTRREVVDKPGIIGARWWQESVATQVPRRQAMTGLVALGGVLAAAGVLGTCVAIVGSKSTSVPLTPDPPDVTFEPKRALDMQKEYGWDFGARGETLVFDGQSTAPFDRSTLALLADDLGPKDTRLTPYFVPTLFQSPTALPTAVATADDPTIPFVPLRDALVPILTAAMTTSFAAGQALAKLLGDPRAKDVAVLVDLPGAEAVAFAAGASSVLDPVFLFDNWPHPRGVVPAHRTLAAAAYYQPLFAKARSARPTGARPLFVLDRARLTSYTDETSQFDNRHTARLPTASNLTQLQIKNLLYVGPNAIDRLEKDDLVDDMLAYAAAKISVRVMPATAFSEGPRTSQVTLSDGGVPSTLYLYGGTPAAHARFWTDWAAPVDTLTSNQVQTYTPTPRTTAFSSGVPTPAGASTRPRPSNFGMIPVAIAVGTGVILGAKLNRNGSWNRTPYSSSSS